MAKIEAVEDEQQTGGDLKRPDFEVAIDTMIARGRIKELTTSANWDHHFGERTLRNWNVDVTVEGPNIGGLRYVDRRVKFTTSNRDAVKYLEKIAWRNEGRVG